MPYRIERVKARHALADEPVTLPLSILLALPAMTGEAAVAGLFNLPAAINMLLGDEGWERSKRVMNPAVFAPGWNDRSLLKFLSTYPPVENRQPIGDRELLRLRIGDSALPASRRFAIRHFAAGTVDGKDPTEWHVKKGFASRMARGPISVAAGDLAIPASDQDTRLVVMQTHSGRLKDAREIAASTVSAGGPAILLVESEKPSHAIPYLTDFYAQIIHNQKLSTAAAVKDSYAVTAELWLGEGGDELLTFDGLVQQVKSRIAELTEKHAGFRKAMQSRHAALAPYLHKATSAPMLAKLDAVSVSTGSDLDGLWQTLNFQHEYGGVLPLVKISDALPSVAGGVDDLYRHLKDMEEQLSANVHRAPRVLNANFADRSTGTLLRRSDGLVADQPYHLLVDVGPRWSKAQSIVIGGSDFPEMALPDDGDGFPVQVLLIGEDLVPAMSSAWIWVPRKSGRSVPYDPAEVPAGKAPSERPKNGKPAPVAIPVVAPLPSEGKTAAKSISSRLSLYYDGNLLQSASITVGFARRRGEILPMNRNEVRVDYALTNTLQDVRERCAPRRISFTGAREAKDPKPVTVNITLNDNGLGDHRIIVLGRSGNDAPAPGWSHYSPPAALPLLTAARTELLNCFYERNMADGSVRAGSHGLSRTNAKSYDQFRFDLRELCKVGSALYNMITGQIEVEAGAFVSAATWARQLRAALAKSSVIQIARTNRAEYALPWALVYDIPMPGPHFEWCKVLDDWKDGVRGKDGTRRNPAMRESCPHANDQDHQQNIYCPYGFWGLKHVIEQPASQLPRKKGEDWSPADVEKEFAKGEAIDLAIAVTRDPQLDLTRISEHLQKLAKLPLVKLCPPSPAADVDTARQAMAHPDLVYFLCHGDIDKTPPLDQAYLGIGPRDMDKRHMIYVSTVQGWVDSAAAPNLAEWNKRRPLVFINGCQTANLSPEQILSFVTGFNYARASGIIGTEVSVQLPVATEAADEFLGRLFAGEGAGQALHEMRWQLANKGNLLGLAYTLFAMSDLNARAAQKGAPADRKVLNAA